jgi:hypothetical protein
MKFFRHSHEISQRGGRHFLHNVSPMNLKSDLTDPELSRGLFIEKSADYQWQHIPFPRRQRFVAFPQRG